MTTTTHTPNTVDTAAIASALRELAACIQYDSMLVAQARMFSSDAARNAEQAIAYYAEHIRDMVNSAR